MIDLGKVKTYPIVERKNLVKLSDLIRPESPPPAFDNLELHEVAGWVASARKKGRPVIWMMGAHVIKSGLSLILIDLIERGIVTHVATNGAGSIHDFELAMIGETSEDVATSIEDGTFGMAEETGAFIHQALKQGVRDGLGYGESIGRFMSEHPEIFPHRDVSVAYRAFRLGVPFTVHKTMGTDIIDQHPKANFGVAGWATGQDFKIFCYSVSQLHNGVFLNFGSAVTGPEVFLKALSITRNLGYKVEAFTTANFDLIALGDYHSPVGKDHPHYYYRPRKNIVNRPVSLGGQGYHITGDHVKTIPNLYHMIVGLLGQQKIDQPLRGRETGHPTGSQGGLDLPEAAGSVLRGFLERNPEMSGLEPELARVYRAMARCVEVGGCIYICGNGGSMADALHISGELLKSYTRKRPLDEKDKARFAGLPGGAEVAEHLEGGFRAVVLGANPALSSAVDNDNPCPHMAYAQEVWALGKPGDILIGISTSGRAQNVRYAVTAAKAKGLTTIALTGASGGPLAEVADLAICVPENRTDRVQEQHVKVYHCLCEMLEATFYC